MVNIFIILIIIGIFIIVGGFVINFIKKRKKSKRPKPLKPIQSLPPAPEDIDHPNIMVKSLDSQLYEEFMNEYDSGQFKFKDLGYRKGAEITCPFGIAEGFKYINKRMEWGFVRLHTGVDRARGGNWNEIPDIVQVPFNFDKSAIIEYKNASGHYYGYGTLIILTNSKYQFEMRIAHMDPHEDIIPWSYNRLKQGLGFERGWYLGSAGTAGDSSANHTHTEFISIDDSCEVFDLLLEKKYGDKTLVEYNKGEILKEYRKYKHFVNEDDKRILKDWQAMKDYRGAFFVNKYKYKFQNKWGTRFTRYASNLLFNGL
ncbi:MAG: hypothetical protein ACOC3V_03450 [bacterium]